MSEKNPRWQRYVALAVFLGLAAAAYLFRGRLSADFLPPDRSAIGPNLVAWVIQAGAVLIVAVLIWPPTRRRAHRFLDRKLAATHEKLDALRTSHADLHVKLAKLHERHDEHSEHLERIGRSVAELHEKLEAQPSVRPVAVVAPRRAAAKAPGAKKPRGPKA